MQIRVVALSITLAACTAGSDKDTDSDVVASDETDVVVDTDETDVVVDTDETDVSVDTDETDVPVDTDETDVPVDTDETDVPVDTDDTDAPPVDVDGDTYFSDVDCNDGDATIHPGAVELCDAADRDCDGDPVADAADITSWYMDDDGDGFGGERSEDACDAPPDSVGNTDDCDDDDAALAPGLAERCDGQRNDCDGGIWAPILEDGIVTFTDAEGAVSNVTGQFQGTLALQDGTYSVCPGTWRVRVTATGVDTAIVGRGEATTVVIDGSSGGSVATVQGGALRVENLWMRKGVTTGAGGVLSATDADIDIYDAYIDEGSAQDGGVIALSGGSLDVYRSRIGFGAATRQGGVLFARDAAIYAEDTWFTDSTATAEGGGLMVVDSATQIVGESKLLRNTASEGGGAYIDGGYFSVSGEVRDNTVTFSGGGLAALSADMLFVASAEVTDNEALLGGGVAAYSVDVVQLNDSVFRGNVASGNNRGGGGAFLDRCGTSVSHSEFSGNRAGASGGGVSTSGGSFIVTSGEFFDNDARSGAGIDLSATDASLTDTTVSGNTAVGIAGGIFASAGGLSMQNCVVEANVAGERGGGLYLGELDALITDTSILDNEAGTDGGGLYTEGVDVDLTGVDVGLNVATGRGGGIYAAAAGGRSGDVTLIAGTRVRENVAPDGGGAYVAADTTLTCGTLLLNQDPGITANRSPATDDVAGVMLEASATAVFGLVACDMGVSGTAADNRDVGLVSSDMDVFAGGSMWSVADDFSTTFNGASGPP